MLDNGPINPPQSDLVSGNISAEFLFPNFMSLIQSMFQGLIQNFKCFYRRSFVQDLLNSDSDVKDFQKQYNLNDAIFGIAIAWNLLKKIILH